MSDRSNVVRDAYLDWQNLQPRIDSSCCNSAHYYSDNRHKPKFHPKPDCQVCARERAWRKYVRLRDNNEHWMPVLIYH